MPISRPCSAQSASFRQLPAWSASGERSESAISRLSSARPGSRRISGSFRNRTRTPTTLPCATWSAGSDHAASHNQTFALETGQEPARILMAFLNDVARANLGINFDPANMILYGTGDPIEALGILAPKVLTIHCKDGDWPEAGVAGALGKEKALGAGSVGVPRFLAKLREIGYRGPLSIEREASDPARRIADIRYAIALLAELKA